MRRPLHAAVARRRQRVVIGGTPAASPSFALSTFTPASATGTADGATTNTHTLTLYDTNGVLMAGQSVTFTTELTAVDAAQSTVTVSTGTIVNDGVASCAITVVAKNAAGTVLPNIAAARITLAVTGSGNTVTQPASATNAMGSASGSFVSTGAATKTVSATIDGVAITQTQSVIVSGDAAEIDPGTGDTVWYDDDFTDTATWAARRTKYNTLVGIGAPAAIFEAPSDPTDAEIVPVMVAPGYNGSSYAIELPVPTSFPYGTEAKGYFPIRLIGGQTVMGSSDTLFVDMWMKIEYDEANFLWWKGLSGYHPGGGSGPSGDRTEWSVYHTSASLGPLNIHPQSNNKEAYMHLENGAGDAPATYKRWTNINGAGYLRHTHVFKKNTTTGTTRDGINRWYIEGEKLIDISQYGLDNGWLVDRVSGVSESSTSPYPGNVGDKYTSVTGDACLLGVADEVINVLIFPAIIGVYGRGTGAGKITIGRIRCWTRP